MWKSAYRTTWIVALLALGWVLAATGLAQDTTRDVRIGIFPLRPLNFMDEDGVAQGLYPDLIRATADRLRWNVTFVPGDWATSLDRLDAGEIDLMTTIAFSPERAKTMDFSREPVCDIWGQVFVHPEGGIAGIRDLAGRTVGVMRRDINGVHFAELARRLGIACEIREFASHDEIFSAVGRREIAGGVAPQHFGLRNAEAHGLVASTIQFAPFSVFFATRKGVNGDLLAALDEDIRASKADPNGFYYRRLNEWMGVRAVERRVFPPWLIAAVVGVLGIALVLFSTNRMLNARVRARTAELQRRESQYRHLVESANCVILRLAPDGTIEYMNPFGCALFGFTADELTGRNIVGTLLPAGLDDGDDPSGSVQSFVARPVDDALLEQRTTCRDGSRLSVEWSVRARKDAAGAVLEFLCVGIDTTERRRLESDLQQARKMEALGTLAGGIAHDFNNMLHGILGASDLLEEDAREDQGVYIDIIRKASRRAAELIAQMLAFSRKGDVTLRPVDLSRVVRDAVRLLERSLDKKVEIEVRVPSGTWVLGDPAQLQNVVINLGVNAGHAMLPGGGRLRIETSAVELDSAACQASSFDVAPGAFVRLTVSDEGQGIPPEALEKIFEPFFTTKGRRQGTGLGLAAVFGIVRSHGGTIEVESTVGEGTRFTMLLPASDAESEAEQSHRDEGVHSGTVLVVDDEPLVRDVSDAILRSLGYRVVLASNGREAVDVFARDPSGFAVVLLDMIMPVMNGREAFEALRALRPDVPVVIVTGFADDDSIADLRADGPTDLLVKPVAKSDLMRVLGRLLAST